MPLLIILKHCVVLASDQKKELKPTVLLLLRLFLSLITNRN